MSDATTRSLVLPDAVYAVDVQRPSWVIAFLREVRPTLLDDAAWPAVMDEGEEQPALDFEGWVEARIPRLWLRESQDVAGPNRPRLFLHTLARQARLMVESLRRVRGGVDQHLLLEILLLWGASVDAKRAVADLAKLLADARAGEGVGRDEFKRRLRGPARAVGRALLKRRLPEDHPLNGHGVHRLVLHHDALLTARLAADLGREPPPGPDGLSEAFGARTQADREERLLCYEAVLGLVWADGRLDSREARLLTALATLGGISRAARQALVQQPRATPAAIAAGVQNPCSRRFLLRELTFAALIDGGISSEEEAWIEAVAEAFGAEEGTVLALYAELGALFEAHPELTRGVHWTKTLSRLGRAMERSVDRALRRNISALGTELAETGDMARLLALSTRRNLTADESARVRQQLVDLAKAVPSLALVAAPGGTVLLPVLAKVLPFSILPSSFEDADETF
ncbi:MAG: LETM1 domain-containing protein [Myxococcota bacterium]